MIKITPDTIKKTPNTEKVTPDTILHDTLPDPESKSLPPADQGRTEASRPCLWLNQFYISLKRKCKKNIVVCHVFSILHQKVTGFETIFGSY
jgi:hypothetical protein